MSEEMSSHLEDFDDAALKLVRYFNQVLSDQDISRQQLFLLRTLCVKKKSTVTELAEELALSTSATTIALNRLVKSGHIIRSRDEQDRRVVWVELSPEATELMQDITTRRRVMLTELLRQLDEEERLTFIQLMHKMVAKIE